MAVKGSHSGQRVLKAKCAIDSRIASEFQGKEEERNYMKWAEAHGQLRQVQTEHEALKVPAGEGVVPPVVRQQRWNHHANRWKISSFSKINIKHYNI